MRATPLLTSALLLLSGSGMPSATQQTPAATPPSETELVSIDFMALGADGRPVKDLTASQVSLKVDGRERPIYALQYVELSGGESLDRSGGPIPKPLAPPYGSNLLADAGRVVMLIVNHESISPGKERPARDAAIKFLGSVSPRDRIGLITVPRGGVLVEPTRDHEQIRTGLMQIAGLAPQTAGQGMLPGARMPAISAGAMALSERACMSRLTLNTLTGVLQSMESRDAPKTIVFISSGLTPPTRDAPMTSAPGQCELKAQHYEEVGAAARAARAHFYVIQPNDLVQDPAANAFTDVTASRFSEADDALSGLQNLAGVTGGDIVRLTGSADGVFARVASESSGYYLADFVAEPDERNGLGHRVEVRLTDPAVKVRHRAQLVIAKAEPRKDPRFLSPHDMLRGARRFRRLPLRTVAFSSKMPEGSELKVLAIAESMDPAAQVTSAAMGLIDGRNRLVRQWTAEKRDLGGPMIITAFPVPPGNYRLRVAAIDAAGRHGTVDYSFNAELSSAGPLKVSGIALGVAADGQFTPKMVFGNEPVAVVYAELYGRMRTPVVRIELAESMEGQPVASVSATVTETSDPDRRIAVGAVPISALFPGDYVVRVVVTDDGRPLGRAVRTLRKVLAGDGS